MEIACDLLRLVKGLHTEKHRLSPLQDVMTLTTYFGILKTRPCSHFVFQKVKRVCSSKMASTDAATPWHAAYPPPLNKTPPATTRQAALEMMKDCKNIAGKDYVLIDLRRTDHEVAPIFRSF